MKSAAQDRKSSEEAWGTDANGVVGEGWPGGSGVLAGASVEEVGPVGNDGRASDPSAAQVQRDPFADDVLERLIASNHNYQREHGHYVVPLAERLLAARAEIARLREQVNSGRTGRERAEGLPEGTLPRV